MSGLAVGATVWSIPACAGNLQRPAGLSPRVRGNRQLRSAAPTRRRSIPACAGEPRNHRSLLRVWLVYPRVCGGTNHCGAAPTRRVYPRVCGGTSVIIGLLDWVWLVYPRVCGGTSNGLTSNCSFTGLSPRVRGNRPGRHLHGDRVGSIPACAGEPSCSWTCRQRAGVYPRVCGGTRCSPMPMRTFGGLSPRVRGNLLHPIGAGAVVRSIPACAGEPAACRARRPRRPVYPRVCGGTYRRHWTPGTVHMNGLSPRVRGNQICSNTPMHGSYERSIPACAGEPQ